MIDIDKTRTIIEEVAHWFHYHKVHPVSPAKQREFYSKTLKNMLIIQARLFEHIDLLKERRKPGGFLLK